MKFEFSGYLKVGSCVFKEFMFYYPQWGFFLFDDVHFSTDFHVLLLGEFSFFGEIISDFQRFV